jgi:hypothetical protein
MVDGATSCRHHIRSEAATLPKNVPLLGGGTIYIRRMLGMGEELEPTKPRFPSSYRVPVGCGAPWQRAWLAQRHHGLRRRARAPTSRAPDSLLARVLSRTDKRRPKTHPTDTVEKSPRCRKWRRLLSECLQLTISLTCDRDGVIQRQRLWTTKAQVRHATSRSCGWPIPLSGLPVVAPASEIGWQLPGRVV